MGIYKIMLLIIKKSGMKIEYGFFDQYYQGTDYYNMYFTHYLKVFRFGLMTEVLRF